MKKMYLLGLTVLTSLAAQAQINEGFETLVLTPESYDNGQTAGGQFTFPNVTLTNTYTVDTVWGDYWSGFAVSNVTDNTTAGEQYGSYAGEAFGGHGNFAVYAFNGELELTQANFKIDSFKITNSTYAAISMRDGDFFGKQFGSNYNALGNLDGTNGEDFFKVWIFGEDASGNNRDSMEFYLADYRFQDNNMDYILNEWVNIDLSGFGFAVAHLDFRLESSDVGMYGMNTPAYFVMDEVSISQTSGTDILTSIEMEIYPNPVIDVLHLKAANGKATLLDLQGNIIEVKEVNGSAEFSFEKLAAGTYILQFNDGQQTLTKKVVK